MSTLLGLSPKLPALRTIVSLEEIPEDARRIADAWGKERRVRILTLKEGEVTFRFPRARVTASLITVSGSVEAIGEKSPLPPPPVTAGTIATICYTSVCILSSTSLTCS